MDIKSKSTYRRVKLFGVKLFGSGKLGRLVVDALRNGQRPMSTAEIVAAIVETLGYGHDEAKDMTQRVRANLLYQASVSDCLSGQAIFHADFVLTIALRIVRS